jgi:hypothetical protein
MAGMKRATSPVCAAIVLVTLLILLMLYVLAVGPAHRLGVDGTIRIETVRTIYWPMIVVANAFPPAENALDWYCGMWMRVGR